MADLATHRPSCGPFTSNRLNRFFVSEFNPEIERAFTTPPNPFDELPLNGLASSLLHTLVQWRFKEKTIAFESELNRAQGQSGSQVEKTVPVGRSVR
jgi:hypothetical protein